MLLPDVNVWLAPTFDSHVHHPQAKLWFDALSADIALFCRTTQQGFLRLATNPAVFGSHALNLQEAWQKFDLSQSDPCVSYMDEPSGVETDWRTFTERQSYSPKVWTDAYLAAFAVAADPGIATFDRAFSQFQNLRCTILS